MFTQFFGNYLINAGIITTEQLIQALVQINSTKLKLGDLAINKGYMSIEEVEKIHELQKVNDKKMGDLAIGEGYLTAEQVLELLSSQNPQYLALCQALLNNGAIDQNQFKNITKLYKEKFQILEKEEECQIEKLAKLLELFYNLYDFSGLTDEIISKYFILLINNFIRFIGDDFVFISMTREKISLSDITFSQGIKNKLNINSILTLDEKAAIGFASRFSKQSFSKVDEYVESAISDFLNLHNGMFIVNLSNQYGIELDLTNSTKNYNFEEKEVIVIKLEYTFGKVNFIICK